MNIATNLWYISPDSVCLINSVWSPWLCLKPEQISFWMVANSIYIPFVWVSILQRLSQVFL